MLVVFRPIVIIGYTVTSVLFRKNNNLGQSVTKSLMSMIRSTMIDIAYRRPSRTTSDNFNLRNHRVRRRIDNRYKYHLQVVRHRPISTCSKNDWAKIEHDIKIIVFLGFRRFELSFWGKAVPATPFISRTLTTR